MKVGASLRESIDHGLGQSRYGIVILSPNFFQKQWPQKELDGLFGREADGRKVILPVWHKIGREMVRAASPMLVDRVAALSKEGLDQVIDKLMQVISPEGTTVESTSGVEVLSSEIRYIRRLTQEQYNALPEKDETTLYLVGEVERQHGKDVQPLHQLLQVSLAKLQRWSPAGIRVWWKMVATAVVFLAALTTVLVNFQEIKGWVNADSRLVEATDGDRTSPVQVAPNPNKDADEQAAGFTPSGSQTKSLDKKENYLQTGPPAAIESRPAASAGAPPEVPRQPAADTDGPSGDPKVGELASQIRKEVASLAKSEEKWTVSDGPRISVTLWNPKNPNQGRGHEINASNRDDLESVMDSLRSEWAARAREDEEYIRDLLKK